MATEAVLFWGYCWAEGCRELITDSDGNAGRAWEVFVLRGRGLVDPWEGVLSEIVAYSIEEAREALDDWEELHLTELEAYESAVEAVQAEFACELGRHCTREWQMPYAAVTASVQRAHRGYPRALASELLVAKSEWGPLLERFVRALGVDTPAGQVPGWWLVSWWSG